MISFEEFQRLDLRVGKIIEASRIEGSEKLVKLEVDLGQEQRQLVAGIGQDYAPEELIGRVIVVVANLESRNLMGIESQGMLLAVDSESGPVLLMPDKPVPAGSKIR
ncbi:MAG: methionine--tRNA ligase subunit beta [Candidatus Doudnabacteria bacterium]|nr:methionine--tRNA ligase subunit beta [Candidatus Doudnabacteria bacterium]